MALQVWLPLNGSLNNNGLSSMTVSGTPVYGVGKIGQALDLINSQQIDIVCPGIANVSSFSICFWIKGTKDTSDADWSSPISLRSNKTGGSEDYSFRFGKDNRASYNGYPICMYCNSGYNIVTSNSLSFSTNEHWDKWIHICFTTDGTNVKAYRDGVLVSSASNGTNGWLTGNIRLRGERYNGFLNDFRVYDSILSPREVAEIAKGLVLHYPLNREGFGCDNLIANSHNFSGWSINSLFSVAQDTNGEYVASASRSDATTNVWSRIIPTMHFVPDNYSNGITVSFDFKCNDISALDHKCICSLQIYKSDGTRIGWYESKNTFTEANYVGSTTLQNGVWKRLICHFTQANMKTISTGDYTTSDVSYTTVSFQLVKNGSVSFKKIKIEDGTTATPWTPNSADTIYSAMGLNSNTVYDCSGYRRDGAIIGSLTYSSNTPRYSVSTYFNGSSDIRSGQSSFGWFDFKEGTVSAWYNPANTTQTWASVGVQNDSGQGSRSFNICNYGGKAAIVVGYDSSWGNVSSSFSMNANTWYHLCATITNGNTVILYVNGSPVLTQTVNNSTGTIASTTQFAVGVDLPGSDERFTGYLSDVRFYVTALTAQQVLELYQTPISLAYNGVLLSAELQE